jgi:hypothetical protein
MLYAILAYHEEDAITVLTPDEDAALMQDLYRTHDKINRTASLGPAARLDFTPSAVTLRGPGEGMVIDGPFAETKEQLLGLYVLECGSIEEAVAAARDLRRVNKSAVYEIRPITVYLPGKEVQGV